jgi:Rieske 2Fe-2S family protein
MTQTQPDRPASVSSELAVPERWRLGDAFVPKGRYIDREFLELELEQLFPRVWLNACRLEEVEKVGSYVEFVVGDQSILVVRADSDTIKAYYNSCRHRGTRLVQGRGRTGSFRCPFHGWMWELDGAVRYVYRRDEFLPRADEELCLPEVKVDTWGGWVFINMDPDAEPLLDYLDPLPTELDGYRIEDMRFAWYKTVILPANWKTAIDAFIEAYHVAATHPGYVRPDMRSGTPTSIAEMETWMDSPTVTFDRHACFKASAGDDPPEQMPPADPESVVRYADYQLHKLGAMATEWDLQAARQLQSSWEGTDPMLMYGAYDQLRRACAAADGVTLPTLSIEQQMNEATDWHIFPNTVFLPVPTSGAVLAYRSRPNGLDPDSCIWDVWSLRLFPDGGAPDVEPEFYEDWREGNVGEVLTQDFQNMAEVTMGLHSRGFDGHRLNTKQEMSVYNHHRVADRYLFGP